MTQKKRRPKGAANDINITPGKMKYEGLPFRGKPMDIKTSDPVERQPEMALQAHVDVFCTTDPEDLDKYREVVQKLVKDEAILSYEEKEYDPELKGWRILIVYSDIFYTNPPEEE